jgi:hypothetical protein
VRRSERFLNQDLQDFQDYIGRRRFGREGYYYRTTSFTLFLTGSHFGTCSHWFESGFRGLPITSPVGVGRLLLHGAFITLLFAYALRIGEKKGIL